VRINKGGRLFTLTYGRLSSVQSRPIEIKPFFHYYPGSSALTFSTWSCNFNCAWCQNYHLSGRVPDLSGVEEYHPERLVEMALQAGDDGICVSFNEPTLLFEYCLDLFPLAKARGLYCCFVSNGYMTAEALDALIDAGLDGMNVDVKGRRNAYDRYIGRAKVDGVWETAEHAARRGVHVEIVCLLVTGVSDDEATIDWIVSNHLKRLGPDVPIHFTRYFPARHFDAPATPPDRLEFARECARQAGIKFVYLGNLPGRGENTHCPACGKLLIRRSSFATTAVHLTADNRCPACSEQVPIRGEAKVSRSRRLL